MLPGLNLFFQAGLGIPESWYFKLKSVKTGVLPHPFHQNILDRDTLVSFRDRDLIRLTRCHMPSEKFDAELLHNIQVSFYLTSYVTDMNYITHRRFFVFLYQLNH